MDGQNLQQDSMDENMESSCVLLVEKTAVSEGICGKGRDQSPGFTTVVRSIEESLLYSFFVRIPSAL